MESLLVVIKVIAACVIILAIGGVISILTDGIGLAFQSAVNRISSLSKRKRK